MKKIYYVYILANRKNGALYTGVTSNLLNRVSQHKVKFFNNSFTSKYKINKLVYYEEFGDVGMAIQREKTIKKYNRQWKINLIEKDNPNWDDLFPIILNS